MALIKFPISVQSIKQSRAKNDPSRLHRGKREREAEPCSLAFKYFLSNNLSCFTHPLATQFPSSLLLLLLLLLLFYFQLPRPWRYPRSLVIFFLLPKLVVALPPPTFGDMVGSEAAAAILFTVYVCTTHIYLIHSYLPPNIFHSHFKLESPSPLIRARTRSTML